jgi:hypothetical protein
LVNGKWKNAEDIKVGDNIQVMAAFCEYCGKAIPWWDKFCDISCSSKKTTERQWSDPNHRKNISKKTSEQMYREYANGDRDNREIIKKARSNMRKKYGRGGYLKWAKDNNPKKLEEIKQKRIKTIEEKYGSVQNMICSTAMVALGKKARSGGTAIEVAMGKYLKKQNKKYYKQFKVGRRYIDFYVPKDKLFIECDGYPWHEDKIKERKRDYEILTKYPDHTIAHVDYKPNPPKWENWTLVDLLQLNHDGVYDQLAMPVVAIERKPVKQGKWNKKTVYNFAVEDDESYIVNGLVSHNCRCVLTYHTKKLSN